MKRPSYRLAIDWIADNDDTEWLDDEPPIPCVTATLVADLFGVADDKVIRDIARSVERRNERGEQ